MDIRPITDSYAVSPQIGPEHLAEIKTRGFTTLICNRPDAEVPPGLHAADMRAAAEAQGLHFVDLPFAHGSLSLELIEAQKAALADAPGPVLAYCASGNRCSMLWALGEAGSQPTDAILAATRQAGYDLEGLRPQIDAMADR